MLTRLKISNIALIDKSDIVFDAGFSALTGETGAGKSILIESVSFVLGDRSSRDSIRTGASKASAEADFVLNNDSPALRYLTEHELDDQNNLNVYRELSLSGRNVCRINGTPVTASELKELGNLLVDMHGQHAHQSLLDTTTHLQLIDAFSKDDDGLLAAMQEKRETAIRLLHEWNLLKTNLSERMRKIDMFEFQLKEIDRVSPIAGEEQDLESRRNLLRNAETITEGLNTAYQALFGEDGALTKISEAKSSLSRIEHFDSEYHNLAEHTEESYYALEDVAYTLRDAKDSLVFDPDELEQIEGRLASLQNLKRKYGATIEEVIEYRDRIAEELNFLTDSDNQSDAKEQAYRKALESFENAAVQLSKRRKKTAKILCENAKKQLYDMGMPNAEFEAMFTEIPADVLSENGIDQVEFMLSANKGEPLKPLTKVASGGEISRIMLALKIALSDADQIETLIFDEIDTGISGMVANAVAKKMRELSKRHQILCVTHLPQIAAAADHHYVASKESDDSSTRSNTRMLNEEERAEELARIMGSTAEDKVAIEHAKKLLSEGR